MSSEPLSHNQVISNQSSQSSPGRSYSKLPYRPWIPIALSMIALAGITLSTIYTSSLNQTALNSFQEVLMKHQSAVSLLGFAVGLILLGYAYHGKRKNQEFLIEKEEVNSPLNIISSSITAPNLDFPKQMNTSNNTIMQPQASTQPAPLPHATTSNNSIPTTLVPKSSLPPVNLVNVPSAFLNPSPTPQISILPPSSASRVPLPSPYAISSSSITTTPVASIPPISHVSLRPSVSLPQGTSIPQVTVPPSRIPLPTSQMTPTSRFTVTSSSSIGPLSRAEWDAAMPVMMRNIYACYEEGTEGAKKAAFERDLRSDLMMQELMKKIKARHADHEVYRNLMNAIRFPHIITRMRDLANTTIYLPPHPHAYQVANNPIEASTPTLSGNHAQIFLNFIKEGGTLDDGITFNNVRARVPVSSITVQGNCMLEPNSIVLPGCSAGENRSQLTFLVLQEMRNRGALTIMNPFGAESGANPLYLPNAESLHTYLQRPQNLTASGNVRLTDSQFIMADAFMQFPLFTSIQDGADSGSTLDVESSVSGGEPIDTGSIRRIPRFGETAFMNRIGNTPRKVKDAIFFQQMEVQKNYITEELIRFISEKKPRVAILFAKAPVAFAFLLLQALHVARQRGDLTASLKGIRICCCDSDDPVVARRGKTFMNLLRKAITLKSG